MQHERRASSAHFITLTYNTKNVPITENGFKTLRKRDLQLFFKRLRKLHGSGSDIKYYGVGEYGTKRLRPHYHVILFNSDPQSVLTAWTIKGVQIGDVHFGEVTGASIGYTLEYITEGSWRPKHRNDDRRPQFAVMSKGLGLCYLTPKMIAWHHADQDNRMYCNLEDGKKIGMPRYYKNKIYDEETRKRIGETSREKMLRKEARAKEKEGVDTWYLNRTKAIEWQLSNPRRKKSKI